jgi:hypothetical protein
VSLFFYHPSLSLVGVRVFWRRLHFSIEKNRLTPATGDASLRAVHPILWLFISNKKNCLAITTLFSL